MTGTAVLNLSAYAGILPSFGASGTLNNANAEYNIGIWEIGTLENGLVASNTVTTINGTTNASAGNSNLVSQNVFWSAGLKF